LESAFDLQSRLYSTLRSRSTFSWRDDAYYLPSTLFLVGQFFGCVRSCGETCCIPISLMSRIQTGLNASAPADKPDRLRAIQIALVDLLDFLDPNHERFPEHRERLLGDTQLATGG
jgi:hypothetical protein